MRPALAALFLLAIVPSGALACATASTGANCVSVPARAGSATAGASAATAAVSVGQVLGRGDYSLIMNAEYYGLPQTQDGWVYMRIEHDVFRVDWRSHEVLERVTHEAAANF